MSSRSMTRRDFSQALAALCSTGIATRATGEAQAATTADNLGITQQSTAIHQERLFKADRARVYAALTESDRFDKVVRLSDAVRSGMVKDPGRAVISPDVGGGFSFFGGYITGRNLELKPHERLVQAWRTASWEPGAWSIARFDLVELGADTRLVFDHTGFPVAEAAHLAEGWIVNYWEPLTRYLAQS